MLFWAIIGFMVIPLLLTISQIRNSKRERVRKLELIQRRLVEKESKMNDTNQD
jgi:hypothetical protein